MTLSKHREHSCFSFPSVPFVFSTLGHLSLGQIQSVAMHSSTNFPGSDPNGLIDHRLIGADRSLRIGVFGNIDGVLLSSLGRVVATAQNAHSALYFSSPPIHFLGGWSEERLSGCG